MLASRTKNIKQEGFTLVEILVALVIFALLASITSGVIMYASEQSEHVQQDLNWLKQQQFSIKTMQQDIQHIVAQSIFDQTGKIAPPVIALPDEFIFVKYSAHEPAFPLERIHYVWDHTKLYRTTYRIDASKQEMTLPLEKEILFDSISKFDISYLSYGQGFTQNWPPGNLQIENQTPIPVAVKFDITFNNRGSQQIVINIPTTNVNRKN